MRILITGPTGFLGSALARFWADRGHELSLLARPTSNLDRLADMPASVRVVRASTPKEIALVVGEVNPNVIVHTACSYGRKGESVLDVMDANMRLGIILLQSVLESKPLKYTSPTLFMNTGTVLESGVSLYALSKNQFSMWGATLAASSPDRLRFIDIRLQQMYGPGDDASKFTTHVINACLHNKPRLELTAGYQRRDFIHIDDTLCAYNCIINQPNSFAISDAIDVGSGEAVTIREFVELTKQISGASTSLDFGVVPYRAREPLLCVADTVRLQSLGWQPKYSLAEGLSFTIAKLKL